MIKLFRGCRNYDFSPTEAKEEVRWHYDKAKVCREEKVEVDGWVNQTLDLNTRDHCLFPTVNQCWFIVTMATNGPLP